MKRRLLLITSSLLLCLCLISCGSNPPSNETPQTQNSENEIIKLQAEISAMKESLEASKAELKESNKKAKSLEALLDHLNKSVKSLEEKLKQTSDNSQSLEDQLTKAKEETERLKAQLNKEKEKAQNLESHLNRQGEFWADIYLCDDVYLTDDTPIHGSGSVILPTNQDVLEVNDYRIILCSDKCDPSEIVQRAFQGYAPVYSVVYNGEFNGNFKILKFNLEIPEPIIEDFEKKGDYQTIENMTERIESIYQYLLVLDDNHYAYVCLERKEGVEKHEHEAELADSIVKSARVYFEAYTGK
ncbi:MAG: hypothetical protein E7665_05665 [Ruminococcaceae bacterium]|nr:hypothetical protein [Oscillospiraceae bacterium]